MYIKGKTFSEKFKRKMRDRMNQEVEKMKGKKEDTIELPKAKKMKTKYSYQIVNVDSEKQVHSVIELASCLLNLIQNAENIEEARKLADALITVKTINGLEIQADKKAV